jgi:hypothetical protein
VPVAEASQQTQTAAATKSPSRTHRRAKAKRVAKHAVKNRRPTAAKKSPARRVESRPSPVRAAKQRQAADDENPL